MSLNGDNLKAHLQKLGLANKTMTRKAQFAEAIEESLKLRLDGFTNALSENERLWLAEAAHQGRFISDTEFEAKFGRGSPWQELAKLDFWHRPVLLLEIVIHYDHQDRESILLSSLIGPLRALLPKSAPLGVRVVEELPLDSHKYLGSDGKPLQVFESERIAPAELARVLRLVQAGKIKVTDTTQRPTDSSTRLIGEALAAPDFELEEPAELRRQWASEEKAGPARAHAWGVLVQQCGWAKPKGGTLALTPAGQQLLAFSPEKFREGFKRFVTDGDFDELHRVNHIRGQTGKHKRWISDPGLRKTVVADVLATFPAGQWLQYKEALRLLEASGEDWNVMSSGGFLHICDAQYGVIHDHHGVNSQFLRALLMESLATLGLFDLAYVYPHHEWPDLAENWGRESFPFCGRYDGLRYVRLNPFGAYCLGAAETYTEHADERLKLFRVLPNLDIVLTNGGLDPASRAVLELLAAPQSELVWTLDSQRMLTHIETGGSFAELKQFLENNAADSLPDNVVVFLKDLESKLGACKSACEAILLEWQDETLARLITTSSGLNRLCSHAGSNRIAVARADYRAFARALKKLGYVAPFRP